MSTDPTPARTPYCHKIRYGITGAPTLTEDDMDGTFAPGVGVRPTLIELVYSAAREGKPASVSASVTGDWMRFGKPEEFGGQVDAHFKSGPDGWPAWLAEEARLHDPDAAHADPAPDRPRALHLLEAADLLRDAHHDGLSVQEIGTALRLMADEADPMVGSLARDGLGLDEIAAMPVAPDRALRDRVAAALYERERPPRDPHWPDVYACDREVFEAQADAALSVLPSDGRATVLLWAADAIDRKDAEQGFPEDGVGWATSELRRMAAGGRDEQQGDTTILAELRQHLTDHTPSCNARTDHLMRRAAWALGAPRPAHVGGNAEKCPGCEGTDLPYPFICPQPDPAAAPVAGQPPADTGEEACEVRAVSCSAVVLRVHHAPHDWEPQPGMDRVHCVGYPAPAVTLPGKEA